MNWINWTFEHMTAIAALLTLVYTTVRFIITAAQEKNWSALVALVLADMVTAEQNYTTGAQRKEWEMSMLATHAAACNYKLDAAAVVKISDMIDSLCDMAKVVNA